MFCPRCGKQSPNEANFCASCGAHALPAPDPSAPQVRIVRPRTPRMIAGVCTGLAIHYGWDISLLRILLVVGTILTSGLGLIAYIAAWLLIPDAPYALPPVRMYTPAPPAPPQYPTQTY